MGDDQRFKALHQLGADDSPHRVTEEDGRQLLHHVSSFPCLQGRVQPQQQQPQPQGGATAMTGVSGPGLAAAPAATASGSLVLSHHLPRLLGSVPASAAASSASGAATAAGATRTVRKRGARGAAAGRHYASAAARKRRTTTAPLPTSASESPASAMASLASSACTGIAPLARSSTAPAQAATSQTGVATWGPVAGKLCKFLLEAEVLTLVPKFATLDLALKQWPSALRGQFHDTRCESEMRQWREKCKAANPACEFMFAFHATQEEMARDSILNDGFDPARRGKVNGQYLGPGEYFSVKPGVVQMYGRHVILSMICLTNDGFSYHPFSGIIAVRSEVKSFPVGWFENKKDNSPVLLKFKKRHQALAALKPQLFDVVPNKAPAAWSDVPQAVAHDDNPDACDDNCPVCLDKMSACPAVVLPSCGHTFHASCIEQHAKVGKQTCPVCRKPYGLSTGDQPDGYMGVYHADPGILTLDGEAQGTGTIIIRYAIASTPKYTGTWRQAFLPDTDEGREVLELLKRAWQQKLIFTVGTSLTTGQQNTVVWAGIHHKTSMSGGAARFGFPDPGYLARVKSELAAHGIVPPLSTQECHPLSMPAHQFSDVDAGSPTSPTSPTPAFTNYSRASSINYAAASAPSSHMQQHLPQPLVSRP